MSIKKIIILFIFMISLYSCADYNLNKDGLKKEKKYYLSSGFALVYNHKHFLDKIVNRKINNNEIHILHNFLKPNTSIKIINPINSKFIDTKIYKKSTYPQFFSVVISEKVARILDLNLENPFVELIEIKKNKTFVAKKSNTFDEEKNVAETLPVNEVKMDDLTKPDSKNKKKLIKKNKFILVISDFYYKESANNLMSDLSSKTNFNSYSIKKINNKKYRLFAGPFKSFNALKTLYISLNELGFENLNIYKE